MYRPRAMLFDMDGTLTEPLLDFDAIRAEMGIGRRPILEAMADMPPTGRAAAEAILRRHEDKAAEGSTLNDGCAELLDDLRRRAIPVAVVTRNSRRSAEIVLAKHRLAVDALVTRDDGLFKPDPAPLHLACVRLGDGVCSADAWMVGDGEFDIAAAHAAGSASVWISHGRTRDYAATPWEVVRDLRELHNLVLRYVSNDG